MKEPCSHNPVASGHQLSTAGLCAPVHTSWLRVIQGAVLWVLQIQHSLSYPNSPRTRPAPWTPTRTPLSTSIVPKTASNSLSSHHHPPSAPGAIVQKNRHQAPLCSLPPVWRDHSSSLSMKTAGYVLLSLLCGTGLFLGDS